MMQNPSTWLDLIQNFGLPLVMLVVVVWGFVTERVVPGTRHRKLEERYEEVLKEQRGDAETSKETVRALTGLLTERREGEKNA